MDTSVPLLLGLGRGYTGGYGVGRCEGLESVIHSNLFLRTPGLCTSALGVGEGVLGGAEQGGVKDFVGFEIHTRFHDFWGKKILSSQLGVFWVQFLVFWIPWVLIRLAFYFCLHSHHNKSYHQTPISRQLQWNSSTSPPRPKLTKRLVFLLFENYLWPDFHPLTSKAVIFPLQTFIAVTSCAKSSQPSSSSLWRLSNVRETLSITLDPS